MSERLEEVKERQYELIKLLPHDLYLDVYWLYEQAERADKNKKDLDILDKELAKSQKRVEELEQELMTAHAPIGHLEQENEQLREALKEIQSLSFSDSASQAIVIARQALEEGENELG